MNTYEKSAGFTLVELVTVIVLISILAIFASQRFSGASGFDEYVVRDQLISAIRFAQQRAMYDQASGRCYRVSIAPHGYSVERANTSTSSYAAMSDFALGDGDAGVAKALQNVTLTPTTLFFDGLGNLLGACRGAAAANQTITITAAGSAPLCINIFSTGYVRAAAC